MPLVRNDTADIQSASILTDRLAHELSDYSGAAYPLVLENEIAQTRRFHVTVIWDDWKPLPLVARSRIILNAYQSAFPEKAGRISIAMGLTLAESVSMGLFPYKVIAPLKQTEAHLRSRVIDALQQRGAISGADGLELRFRTLEEAEAARNTLQGEIPGSSWTVVEEANSSAA